MTRTRRLLPILALALPAAFIIAYSAWWYWLAERWPAALARWTDSLAARGWHVETGAVSVSGWPGPLRIALAQPKASDTAGDSWEGPPIALVVSPFAPLAPRMAAPGSHKVALAGRPAAEITTASLEGQVAVWDGAPVSGWLTAKTTAGLGLTADGLMIEVRRLAPPADGQTGAVLAATVELDRLTMPATPRLPFDRTLSSAHLALRLRGMVPPGPLREALAAWRDAGGAVELDSLDLNWPPLTAAGSATVALDTNLQPEMAGGFTLRGAGQAIDRAGEAGMIDPSAAIVAKLALGLAATKAGDGQPEVKVGISIQDRILSIGPVQLGLIPEVIW